MFIFSIANPTQPTQLATFQHATVRDPVIADNQYAFVTLRSGTTCQGFTNELRLSIFSKSIILIWWRPIQ